MRRTKIVATIGPASRDPETLTRMVDAGMDVARLNFSHGTREIHAESAERVRAAATSLGGAVRERLLGFLADGDGILRRRILGGGLSLQSLGWLNRFFCLSLRMCFLERVN